MNLAAHMERFESYLQHHTPPAASFHPHYAEAVWEMVRVGGKRFRPRLFLTVVQACAPMLVPSCYPVALAIEVLHTYSLIHDDLPVMDNAPLRRGHPTLHVRYDEVTAVLAGDALNSYAFALIADAPLSEKSRCDLVRELAVAGGLGGMVLGQALDCHFQSTPLDLQQLRILHEHKTGKLIAASLVMGGVAAGIPLAERALLEQLGLMLGLLFQIEDDIIDATKSSDEAGKPTGHDGSRNSYVTLLGLEGAQAHARALANELKAPMKALSAPLQEGLAEVLLPYLHRSESSA